MGGTLLAGRHRPRDFIRSWLSPFSSLMQCALADAVLKPRRAGGCGLIEAVVSPDPVVLRRGCIIALVFLIGYWGVWLARSW